MARYVRLRFRRLHSRRRFRRGGYRRRFKRTRRYGRRRIGINSTRSRTVRLSLQIVVPLTANTGSDTAPIYSPLPFIFTPTQFEGFAEYASTYSEFRILKANCKVHLALDNDASAGAPLSNQPYTYLRVASRSFVESSAYLTNGAFSNQPALNLALTRPVGDLRQSKFQRQYYPNDIKNVINFNFYPYTLAWEGRPFGFARTGDPAPAGGYAYLKYQSGRRWMPMSFLGANFGDPTLDSNDDVSFFGPYFVRLLNTQGDSQTLTAFGPTVTMTIWCQFRGQK